MSIPFRDKNQDLVKLSVVRSDKVWTKKSGKPVLRKDIDIFGCIDKGDLPF